MSSTSVMLLFLFIFTPKLMHFPVIFFSSVKGLCNHHKPSIKKNTQKGDSIKLCAITHNATSHCFILLINSQHNCGLY